MKKEKIRVFINGFGRIGRSAARIILEDNTLELVGINDIYSYEQMAYLLKYDSVYHTFDHEIQVNDDCLIVDHYVIKLFSMSDPSQMELESLGIDIVLECSGMFLSKVSNKVFLEQGVRKVIISTPPKDDMPVYIFGVNHQNYKQESIISASSCSANAIVPICKIIDKHFGIDGVGMSMYHSYTNYQNLLDSAHYSADIRRTRSATQNIIPLISTAAEAVGYFFPHLKGKLAAKSIRVPIAAITLYDLSIQIERKSTLEEINHILQSEISSSYRNILHTTQKIEESDRYIQSPYSAVIILPFTSMSGEDLLRVTAWQDNEFGYAKRLISLTKHLA